MHSKTAYKLDLPTKFKIHLVFHVGMFKPYHEEKDDPDRRESRRAPMRFNALYDREVDELPADRVVRQRYHFPSLIIAGNQLRHYEILRQNRQVHQ